MEQRRRVVITGIALVGVAIIIAFRFSVIRDFLPLTFIPFAYFQTGQFVLPLHNKFQSWLELVDQKFIFRLPRPVMLLFELAYVCCYPLVPAGMFALYLSGNAQFATEFWNAVLPPAYLCYATFPFIQTLPPRAIEARVPWEPHYTVMRKLNAFVLRHVSTGSNTFPSGHVAASVAVSLELLVRAPHVGIVFLLIALCIAAGAFFGRYHYSVDVVIGAFLALISFAVTPGVGIPGR
jgi:membrane-associated phospholipid phosphatase